MPTFIQRYLDPVDRLGEILFGLIMALGFTGAVRLGVEDADNLALTLVFLLGMRWGQLVGGRSLRIASGLTALGVVLVLITIVLGG
jgi:hypothetical protein